MACGPCAIPLGWVVESTHPDAPPDRGEVNNTGRHCRDRPDSWDAGVGVSTFKTPSALCGGIYCRRKLRDISFIDQPANPEGVDGLRDVAQRHQGAFGFPAPYGHEPVEADSVGFNMDIVGGAVASLCEVYREMVRSGPAGHRVNLLFDHETAAVRVESPYTHDVLRVEVKQPGPLWVRLPGWVTLSDLVVTGAESPRIDSGFLFFAQPPLHTPIEIRFALAEEELILQHRTRSIRARLRGDEVVAMDDFGAELTFFSPFD